MADVRTVLQLTTRRQFMARAGLAGGGLSATALLACSGSANKGGAASTAAALGSDAAATRAAASGAGTPSTAARSATPAETVAPGGTFTTTNQSANADFFDVHQSTSAGLQAWAQYALDGLLRLDEPQEGQFTIKDQIIESWEQVDSDPLTLILHVRKGIKFQNVDPVNGRELTGDDVVFSLKRMSTNTARYPRRAFFADVSAWDQPDKYTIKVTTSKPSASLLRLLADPWTLVVPPEQATRDGDQLKALIGTGPYLPKTLDIGNQGIFAKNPTYWKPGQPSLDSWKFLAIVDPAAAINAFRSGQVDDVSIPGDLLKSFRQDNPQKTEIKVTGVGTGIVAFNLRKAPFNDPRVRQAIASAIDVEGWIATLLAGEGRRSGPICPAFPLWSLPADKLVYLKPDPKKATDLLRAAGFDKNLSFKSITIGGSSPAFVGQSVQLKEDLRQIGVDVQIEQIATTDYTTRLFGQHDFDAACGLDFSSDDPSQLRDRYGSNRGANWSGYANAVVDDLFEKVSTTFDYNERKKSMDQLQTIMLQDAATAFTFVTWQHYFLNPKIRNYSRSPLNGNAERNEARAAYFVV